MDATDSFSERRIDLGGFGLYADMQGTQVPTVVFEAAIWDIGLTWALVQPQVASFAQTLVYDRAGYGASNPSPNPRDGLSMVNELYTLLEHAGVAAPYILVGQSFAGMLVQLFAYQFPHAVAGLVLVDSAHEDQDRRFPEAVRAMAQPMMQAQLDGLCQLRDAVAAQGPEAAPPMFPVPPQFPAKVADKYRAHTVNTVTRLDTMIGELENLETTREQLRGARRASLNNLPIVVLSHGVPASIPNLPEDVNGAYEEIWQELQHELAALSARGKYMIAENAGHMIHHERPDLVTAAIRDIVDMTRA